MAKPKRNLKTERQAYYKRVVEPAKVAADLALCELETRLRNLLLAWPVGGMLKFDDENPNELVKLLAYIKSKDRFNLCFEGAPVMTLGNMHLLVRIGRGFDIAFHKSQEAARRACSYLDDVTTIMNALYPEPEAAPSVVYTSDEVAMRSVLKELHGLAKVELGLNPTPGQAITTVFERTLPYTD